MYLSQEQLTKLENILLDTPARYAIPVLNFLQGVNSENQKSPNQEKEVIPIGEDVKES